DEVQQHPKSLSQRMSTYFATKDTALVPVLQLHVDRGMMAAREFLGARQSKEAFLKAHPSVADAYAKDAAFHDGFDALVWAKEKSPAEFADAQKRLDERNAWYSQSNVRVGG